MILQLDASTKTPFSVDLDKLKTIAIYGEFDIKSQRMINLTNLNDLRGKISTCQGNGNTVCEQNICLIDDNLIHNVNTISHTLGWTAYNYSEFWGRKYQEGLDLRLGTKEPTYRVKSMTKLSSKPESLPKQFNAIDHWPGFISEVRDQGWCGSSWAISTSSGIEMLDLSCFQIEKKRHFHCISK